MRHPNQKSTYDSTSRYRQNAARVPGEPAWLRRPDPATQGADLEALEKVRKSRPMKPPGRS